MSWPVLKGGQLIGVLWLLLMGAVFGLHAKDYSGPDYTSTTWLAGGRIDDHTLGRGAQINYAYTADQFLDLWKIDYPALNSGPFGVSSFTEEFGYDTAGRINSISDQSGTRDLDYEKDRLVETDYTGGALDPYTVTRLHEDGVGRQTGLVVERDGVAIHSATYSYSGDSSELAQVVSGGITSVFERDGGAATGPRLLTRITRGAVQQQYTRDMNAGGRITHANSNGTTSAPTFHYSDFDSHGRRETCATSNGSWDWDYSDGQLQSASNATLGTFQYTYDGSGRRTAYQVPGSGLLNPTLNDLGQVQTLPRDQQYSLYIDAAAGADLWINGQQILNPTFPYPYGKTDGFPSEGGWEQWGILAVLPGAGEPGAAPDAKSELDGYVWIPPLSETMTHDGDGNRQSSAQWDYGWDARNRLIAARTKDHLTAAKGWDLEFDYDAEGRRFKKVVRCYESGQLVEDKTITFVWDGWDLVYERHEDGNQALLLERKYAWGLDISGTRGGAGGAGGLLAIEEIQWNGAPSTSTTVLPLYDGSGHVVGLANTAGTLLAEYWWGPFGELIEASGPMANSNPWRYATKYHDVETGLSYFGHRYYDPLTGQWLSREPLGEGESLNLYAYCHNDPINKVDVLGLDDKNIDEFAIRLGLNLEFGSGSSSRTGPAIDLSAGWEHHFSDNTSSRLDVFTRFSKSGLGHPHNKSKAYTGDWKGYYGAGLGVSFHEGKGGPLDSFLINQYTASAFQNTDKNAFRYGQYLVYDTQLEQPTIVGSFDMRAGNFLLNYHNDSAGPPSLSLGKLLLRNGTDQGFTGSGSGQIYVGDDFGSLRFGIDTYTHARDGWLRFREEWAVPHNWRDRSLYFREYYKAGDSRGESELNRSVMFLSFTSPEGLSLRMDYYDDYAMGQHPIHDGKLITKALKEIPWTYYLFRDQALDSEFTGGEALPLPRFEYAENPGISFTLGYDIFPLK